MRVKEQFFAVQHGSCGHFSGLQLSFQIAFVPHLRFAFDHGVEDGVVGQAGFGRHKLRVLSPFRNAQNVAESRPVGVSLGG